MLEGPELEKAIQNIMKQLRSVNLLYIRKVAMQIRKIGEMSQSSINRLVAMAEMNADIAEITDRLRMMAGVTARELQKVYVKAMNEQFTDPRFRKYLAKFPMKDSGRQRIERYVRSVYRQTAARLYNFSNTTAVREDYVQAVDRAILAASTGAASYSETMRETVRQLGGNGIQIVYASGHKRRLDTAVRQNIADGVNQINKNASIMIGEELGYDAIEISAHARSAPDHEPVQGHVFLLAEFQNMQAGAPFKDIDGHAFAGFRRPIGEWNCRHTPMSFSTQWSKRKWTDEQLQKFIDENRAGCTINGKHKTLYEAMQMMRGLETEIRRQKDTAVAAQAAGDDAMRQQCQLKINALVRQYAAVAKASGNAEKRERMTVQGFRAVKTPPDNQAAVGSPQPPQNGLTNGDGSGTIKAEGNPYDIFDRKIALTTWEKDLAAVNPHFHESEGYQKNCIYCVPTYVLRRKGFNVEALPIGANPEGDAVIPFSPSCIWTKNGRAVSVQSTIGSKYFGKPEIIEAMRDLPDGVMFEVRCQWKKGGAHVFIAEKIDGRTQFIDPQTNDTDVSGYFALMKNNATVFWRIDDAQLNEDLIEYCCKSKGVTANDTF